MSFTNELFNKKTYNILIIMFFIIIFKFNGSRLTVQNNFAHTNNQNIFLQKKESIKTFGIAKSIKNEAIILLMWQF